ncbi:MAG: hypothetical protein GF349_04295, partial [Candidatus Magasanikbacteria bacterium]|nr:hypothetical protein [Candidatus Magasanikbacteria bacterium]
MKKLIYIFICIHLTIVYAEKPQLNFIRYSIREGLPNNQVFDILQDSAGFMWITTSNGLCRYDGYTFKTYNTSQKTYIDETVVREILTDNKGNIWCAGNNLHRYDPSADRFIKLTEQIPLGGIYKIEVDYKNNFWISTDELSE